MLWTLTEVLGLNPHSAILNWAGHLISLSFAYSHGCALLTGLLGGLYHSRCSMASLARNEKQLKVV